MCKNLGLAPSDLKPSFSTTLIDLMFSGLIAINNSQYRSAVCSDDLEQMPLLIFFMSWFDCP
jgi:hypothetical protein